MKTTSLKHALRTTGLWAAIALATSLLAGCGVGNEPEPEEVTGISLTAPSNDVVIQTTQGTAVTKVAVDVAITGDTQRLDLMQVDIQVEATDDAFTATDDVGTETNLSRRYVISEGAIDTASLAVGTYKRKMTIRACLDTACNQELKNSPLTVDYQIEVAPNDAGTTIESTVDD